MSECQWCGLGPCPYPDGSCPPVVIAASGLPDLYEDFPDTFGRPGAPEPRTTDVDDVRAQGEALLAARWDSPLTHEDAVDLANVEVRTDPRILEGDGPPRRTMEYIEGSSDDLPDHETLEPEEHGEE